MSLRIKICHDGGDTWSVHGLSPVPVSDHPSLSASLEYARNACNAAPATIELYADGMYIVAHHERGWPKALVALQPARIAVSQRVSHPGKTTLWSRLAAHVRAIRLARTPKTNTVAAR
jgi:hypothetical protein